MKVIGAGFGRTGTLSVKAALEELGFGPCYHMVEVFDKPRHVELWQAAAEGKPIDWEELFAGYTAAVDWPACTFYQQLMQAYPEAKVLLTVRDPQSWYESTKNTIYPVSRMSPDSPSTADQRRMVNTLVWQRTFGGAFEDKQRAISIFERHIQEVKDRVPAERLLVYDVKEGWEPLCRFLHVAVPVDKPFPHLNDTSAFHQMIQERIQTSEGA
jgi:hypothetical protein